MQKRCGSMVITFLLVAATAQCSGGDTNPPARDGEINAQDSKPSSRDGGGNTGACPTTYASCKTFEDFTSKTAYVSYATADTYQPKCIKIRVGQKVTFAGPDPVSHPLKQVCGPTQVLIAPTNIEVSFTFSVAGHYGYYCQKHGTVTGRGQAGAILVVN